MNYNKEQANLNIQPGERVLILRKAEYRERGWENGWALSMNQYIDSIGIVEKDAESFGIRVKHPNGDSWNYPYFVLAFIDR